MIAAILTIVLLAISALVPLVIFLDKGGYR